MLSEEEVFLQQILEDRDRLFRENSKLKGQIASLEGFDAEKASLLAQIKDKDQHIDKLLQQMWATQSPSELKQSNRDRVQYG